MDETGSNQTRRWGRWSLVPDDLGKGPHLSLATPDGRDAVLYYVPLHFCNSPDEVVDYIFAIREKPWGDQQVVADLLAAFADVLDPINTLCTERGRRKVLTREQIDRLIASAAGTGQERL